MEGLTYFQPADAYGPIEVVEPAHRTGGQKNTSLNLNKDAVKKMSLRSAFREVLQNLVDAVVQANGESFVGLLITQTVRRGNKVIMFHNEAHILGEIVNDGKKVSFVNMGPCIESVNQIVQFGASKKHGVANQAGQHGSGLKYAALKFLTSGYKMDIVFAMEEDQQVECRRIIFKILDQQESLAYTLTFLNPFERFKGAADYHRFELNIRSGEEIPDFNLDDYMLRDVLQIGGPADAMDTGSVILDWKEKGCIYVWNFYVTSYKCVHYAYNLFLANITHDRDQVDLNVLTTTVASVWSRAICTDSKKADLFFTQFLMNPHIPDCVEKWALGEFSVEAAAVLYDIFKTRHDAYPISQAYQHLISPQFNTSAFYVAPKHALDVFRLVLPELRVLLATAERTFSEFPSVPFVCPILMPSLARYFSQVRIVLTEGNPEAIVYYTIQSDILYLCQDYIGSDGTPLSIEALCDQLFFRYKIFPDGFAGTELMEEILQRKKNLAKSDIVINIDVDAEDDDDKDEDYLPSPRDSKKRSRQEEENDTLAPPHGYQYYSGPRLLVKIE